MSITINEKRLQTIHSRQDESRWGRDYQASIRATREEAPSVSIATRIFWPRYQRHIHSLSTPETAAVLLALYHPALFDLHEQRMLSPHPMPHPLTGHPRSRGAVCTPLKGTLNVAERMGHFKWHPTVKVSLGPSEKPIHIPSVWIGDLLLFLEDERGPYCVNWNIKKKKGDHAKPFERNHRGRASARAIERARARHSVEIAYYADAGIPTHDIAEEELPVNVVRNLECVYGDVASKVKLPGARVSDIEAQFSADMAGGLPLVETYRFLLQSQRLSAEHSRVVLYRAIWCRRIRVDLFRPIVADKPLSPERKDVLAELSVWFRRQA